MIYDVTVDQEVRTPNCDINYTVVFVNKGARNATLYDHTKGRYLFGVSFTDICEAPVVNLPDHLRRKFNVDDRVMLKGDLKDLYDIKEAEMALPCGWVYRIENLTGNVGGWYDEGDLELYATGESLKALKEINKATPKKFGMPPMESLGRSCGELDTISSGIGAGTSIFDGVLAEARKGTIPPAPGTIMEILKGRGSSAPVVSFDPEESLLGSVKPYRKPIDVQDALRVLLEATMVQMEYIDRNPDPKYVVERITANKLLAQIRKLL